MAAAIAAAPAANEKFFSYQGTLLTLDKLIALVEILINKAGNDPAQVQLLQDVKDARTKPPDGTVTAMVA